MLLRKLSVIGFSILASPIILPNSEAQDVRGIRPESPADHKPPFQRLKPANDEPLWQGQAEEFFEDPLALRLCQAITDRDQVEVKEILDAGNLDIHRRGKLDMTFLYWAYLQGNLPAFQELIERGASPDIELLDDLELRRLTTRTKGVTVVAHSLLNFSSRPGFFDACVDSTNRPDFQDDGGRSILHLIAEKPMGKVYIDLLPRVIATGVDLDAKTRQGETACHIAVAYNPLGLLLLLKAGADPDIPLPDGQSLIDVVRHKEEVMDYPMRLGYGAVLKWLESRQLELRAREEFYK